MTTLATSAHDKHRAREAARRRSQSAKGKDIGPVPAVVDQARRESCRLDFRRYCETYYPQTYRIAWSRDHLMVIGQIETTVLDGGLFATAMPRGSGKSSLAEQACMWAESYGHLDFVTLIGPERESAVERLASIKVEFETNELLAEDFPEICYPIQMLEGIANRCMGQTCEGERTYIRWSEDEIVLPSIEGSAASGAIMKVSGLLGRIRGMKFKKKGGVVIRPKLAVLDDPQSDEAAHSVSQCEKRERILSGAILGLAGPGQKIAAIMPCTVIRTGDMADRMLSRELHPEWHGTRTAMLNSLPTNEKLWEEYKVVRDADLKAGGTGAPATEFYRANRAAMDEGAEAAWPERFEHDEVSAVQSAMNIKLYRPRAFAAEFQNQPLPETSEEIDDLTADEIAGKLSRIDRGIVPLACTRLTAFVDVQETALYYVVCAWEDNFGGSVIDYGVFPDQKLAYFALRDLKTTLADVITGAGLEGRVYGGLDILVPSLLSRGWERGDGASLKIERLLIDSGQGKLSETIKKFCGETPFSGSVTPSKGIGIGASGQPMSEYTKKEGDRIGLNWRVPALKGRGQVRHVIYDANFWKSFVFSRLATAIGDRGSLTLFGSKAEQHRMFADHMKAEYRVRTKGRGRELDEWKEYPERRENHLLDCTVGATMAASMQGVILPEIGSPSEPKRAARVSFAELQRKKRS